MGFSVYELHGVIKIKNNILKYVLIRLLLVPTKVLDESVQGSGGGRKPFLSTDLW